MQGAAWFSAEQAGIKENYWGESPCIDFVLVRRAREWWRHTIRMIQSLFIMTNAGEVVSTNAFFSMFEA
jgi:hypothetical protein